MRQETKRSHHLRQHWSISKKILSTEKSTPHYGGGRCRARLLKTEAAALFNLVGDF